MTVSFRSYSSVSPVEISKQNKSSNLEKEKTEQTTPPPPPPPTSTCRKFARQSVSGLADCCRGQCLSPPPSPLRDTCCLCLVVFPSAPGKQASPSCPAAGWFGGRIRPVHRPQLEVATCCFLQVQRLPSGSAESCLSVSLCKQKQAV